MYMGFEAVQKGTLAEFYRACVIDFFKKIVGSGNVKLGNETVTINLEKFIQK